LVRHDQLFRSFVLKHIDATDDTGDLEKIMVNAKSKCPAGLRTLCDDVSKQAGAALKQIEADVKH
jgi:hypothetical protein